MSGYKHDYDSIKATMNNQIIVSSIKTALQNYCTSNYYSKLKGRMWTNDIKFTLGNLGKSLNYKVCASGFPGMFDKEWLFDLTWYRENDIGNLTDIGLVVECEWIRNYQEIKYDFQKILIAKADLKLMIFQGYHEEIALQIPKLHQEIEKFSLSANGETYLLAGLDWSNGEFQFYDYIK